MFKGIAGNGKWILATIVLLIVAILIFMSVSGGISSLQGAFSGAAGAAGPGGVCSVPSGYASIQSAVDDPGCTTIQVAAGTYYEHIWILHNVTINGAGAGSTIIDGSASGTVVTIGTYGEPPYSVTLTGLTIQNGSASDAPGGINATYGRSLTIQNSVISNNVTTWNNGSGGINFYNYSDLTDAKLTIVNTIFTGNRSPSMGSAIDVAGPDFMPEVSIIGSAFSGNIITGANGGGALHVTGKTTISNSTFASNTGGAISASISNDGIVIENSTFTNNTTSDQWIGAALHLTKSMKDGTGTAAFTNVTIANNSSGVGVTYGSIWLTNTIIANNGGRNCFHTNGQAWNTWGAESFSLRWPNTDTSCAGTYGDPKLGPLANNGGSTQTMMLQSGSAAIDKITCGQGFFDQRGYYRPFGAKCDIGAVEAGSLGVSTPTASPTITPSPTITRTPTATPPSAATLVPGSLLGYWRFDEGSGKIAIDSSGQNKNGSLVNGPTYFTPSLSIFKFSNPYAVNFSGGETRSHVEISGINISQKSFTVAGWAIRMSTDGKQWLVAQGTNQSGKALVVGFRDNDRFTCAFFDDDLDTVAQYLDTTGWHHWACTFDAATRTRKIYYDGNLVASGTSRYVPTLSGTFYLGAAPWNSGEGYFDGAIDDWRVYSRSLSAAEILWLAQGNP